jgi:K+/H+ antiporter YhaU regulatory subunit KhtT
MALEVVDVPASAVGRTVREEDLGARFGCTILAIRSAPDEDGERARRAVTPGSSFAAGDDVVVLGPTEAIERLVREWVAT